MIETSAPKMPVLAVLGNIASFAEPALSKSGSGYGTMMLGFEPSNALLGKRGHKKYCFTFRPTWFAKDLDPETLESGDRFIFSKNISYLTNQNGYEVKTKPTSALQAFTNTKENFRALARELYALEITPADTGIVAVAAVGHQITDYLTNNPAPFIYLLSQSKEDTGEVDEKGRKVKVANSYYEVSGFLKADKEGKRSLLGKQTYARNAADKLAKDLGQAVEPMFQIAFDVEVLP